MTKHDSKTADELIVENAPDSATHYCCGTYCKANKDFFYDWDGEYWCAYFVPDGYMRSLADIEAIVEKDKKIAELEKAIMSNCYDDVSTSSKRLMSLVTPLNKIEVTKNMNMKKMAKNKGYKFASLLAMTLYENYYMKKPDAVAFELLDTTAGVVSQIDNMLTGVIDEKAEAIRLLKVENETLIAKLRDDNEALKAKDKSIAELENESLKDQAVIMSNARAIIKAKARTSNAYLYMQLFGTGMGTARSRCRDIGLNPDENKTSYNSMCEFINTQQPELK